MLSVTIAIVATREFSAVWGGGSPVFRTIRGPAETAGLQ